MDHLPIPSLARPARAWLPAAFVLSASLLTSGLAQDLPEILLEEVAGGLQRPLGVVAPGDGSGRLFIVEQRGRIWQWKDGELREFLNIEDRVLDHAEGDNEQGLLGLAFPPGFPERAWFYVNYTRSAPARDGATVVSRVGLRPPSIFNPGDPVGNPATEEVLLTVPQPFSNHNGGDMRFGADGYLYVGLGDGGSGGDPGNRAQTGQELLGKMLRLDVEGEPDPGLPYAIPPDNPFLGSPSLRPEIWALGLRNPWRWSFDRLTGDLFIGDVGQNAYEEISYLPGGGAGGANFGWRRFESIHFFNAGTELTHGEKTDPILDLPQSRGERSVTGGFVYRGSRFPRMEGMYFFGDYVSRRLFGAWREEGGEWVSQQLLQTPYRISSFGEGEDGELYLADLNGGGVYRLRDTRDFAYLQIVSTAADAANDLFVFTFGAGIGETYQVQRSADLERWTDMGDPVQADSHRVTVERRLRNAAATANGGALYLRAKRLD